MTFLTNRREFTEVEAQALREKGISSIDHLWASIGEDYNNGINKISASTNIAGEIIICVLADQGERDMALPYCPGQKRVRFRLRQLWVWLNRFHRWLKRHWIEWALAFFFVGIALLIYMATRYDRSVVLTSRDLREGHVLRADDLYLAQLASDENLFTSPTQLEGLILGQNVSRGQLLHFEQVLRLQTVAIEEIPSGTIITDHSVAVVWSPYRADALLIAQDATGHKALRTLRKGEVVLKELVDPNLSEERKLKE